MGCGSSQQAIPPAPPPQTITVPIELPPPPPPPVVVQEKPKTPAVPDDPDVAQPEVLMRQCVSLGWLQDLANDPHRGNLTLPQLLKDVVKPAVASRHCRYVELLDGAARCQSPPVYWVWVEEDGWQHSMAQLVHMLMSHVKMVELPNQDMSKLGIWLDCVCCHASAPRQSREAAREAARVWLSEGTSLRPTLVCMQRGTSKAPRNGTQQLVPAGHQKVRVHSVPGGGGPPDVQGSDESGPEAQQPSEDWLQAVSDLRDDSKGHMTGWDDQAAHVAVLMLWRSTEGVGGFQKAQLDTLNVVYLN